MKVTIVGAGLSGAVAADILSRVGHEVTVFEARNVIGGNCYDTYINNVMVHCHGAHIFHTDNKSVWDYVNIHSPFYSFLHTVVAKTSIGMIRIPLDLSFTETNGDITEEEVIDLIFRDYSLKQWGVPWEELPQGIRNRVPKVLDHYHPGYFSDKWQGVPINGYTSMINSMLSSSEVHLGCNPNYWRGHKSDVVIYTGRSDDCFNNCNGRLKYRSLKFTHVHSDRRETCVINECNNSIYTRSYDNSYWSDKQQSKTVVTYEVPCDCDDGMLPYYPFPDKTNNDIQLEYERMVESEGIILLGRLGKYKYLNMDQAIEESMKVAGDLA